MKQDKPTHFSRRTALTAAGQMLAGIAVVAIGMQPVMAADAKKKAKAAKDDFFFQETPNDDGKNCSGCVNFTPKASGQYGADSGDCGLLEGDVCKHCYCQGWTDKNAAGPKKAGT
jgi:hypothetical protein